MINDKDMKILFGKGADWSRASLEVEKIFNSWLKVSDIKEKEFFERINSDTFKISFVSYNEIVLSDDKGEIGLSLTHDGKEDYENYLTDAAFFLMYLSSKSGSYIFTEKIKKFVKNNILTKVIK